MQTRIGLAMCLSLLASLWQQELAPAQEPILPRQISYDDLATLGDEIEAREMLTDNPFLYRERGAQLLRQAAGLPGANLSFSVAVKRVTEQEVFLFVPDAGDTRIAVQHRESPPYGNLHTVFYSGSRSTHLAHILSKPITLRIGSEIDLEIAKGLRKGDLLVLKGRLETVHMLLGIFKPQAIAVISRVEVSQVNPPNAVTEYLYEG